MCRVADCAMMCSVVLYFGFACCILLKKYIVRKNGMFSIAKCEKQSMFPDDSFSVSIIVVR